MTFVAMIGRKRMTQLIITLSSKIAEYADYDAQKIANIMVYQLLIHHHKNR